MAELPAARGLPLRTSLLRGPFVVVVSLGVIAIEACAADTPVVPGSPAGAAGASTAGSAGARPGGAAGSTSGAAGSTSGGAGGVLTGGSGGVGSAGSAGTTTCTSASACPVPAVTPAGCAEAFCDAGVCKLRARDADGDGQRTRTCRRLDDGAIELGTDCDDAAPQTYLGAWDGPAIGGKPNHCADGIDQDCSGADGDGKGAKGESCVCIPGDVQPCGDDAGGKPIVFPGGKPQGACALGKRTCVVDPLTNAAVFSACVGAVGPGKEICNGGIDDDCDGQDDMRDSVPPLNTAVWSYDGDGDGVVKGPAYRVDWCGDERPTICPPDFPPDASGKPTCTLTRWKLLDLPSGDCDDADDLVRPAAVETCNGDGKDYNCNGIPNSTAGQPTADCACAAGATRACGDCGKGSQTCTAGSWGGCVGDESKVDYCEDGDGDGACTGSCSSVCPGQAAPNQRARSACYLGGAKLDCDDADSVRSPANVELCSAVDEDCDGNAYGAYPAGQPCNNGLVGSCFKAGTIACNSPTSTVCDAGAWADVPTTALVTAPLHGSFDANCDGVRTHGPSSFGPSLTVSSDDYHSTCGAGAYTQDWKDMCVYYRSRAPLPATNFVLWMACVTVPLSVTDTAKSNLVIGKELAQQYVPACGELFVQVSCTFSSGGAFLQATPYMATTEDGDPYMPRMGCN